MGSIMAAPAASQVITTKNVQAVTFGAAAPHDDFPEGGMRMSGELPNAADDTIGVYGGSSYSGGFALTAGVPGGGPAHIVCPCAKNSTGVLCSYNMFGSGSGVGPVVQIAQWFRKFRFRRLDLIYEGNCPTTTTGSVQISFDPDINAVINRVTATSPQSATASSKAVRFPAWTPHAEVPLITERKATPSDLLYENLAAGVGLASSLSNADQLLFIQGGVVATVDTVSSAAIWGRYRWRFVVDLYGFSNYANDGTALLAKERLSGGELDDIRRLLAAVERKESKETPQELSRPVLTRQSGYVLVKEPETPPNTPAAPVGSAALRVAVERR